MIKIVNIPLDERPCTYDYPNKLAALANDINFVTTPRNILGDIKKPGNVKAISEFLLKESKDAAYAIVAIDTLLYGGIVPSRLHYETKETLLPILNVLKECKKQNKKLKIFAYHLMMRCPSYNGNDEEPDYYALCGEAIFNIGYLNHLKETRALTEKEEEKLHHFEKYIKDNDYQKYVDDYLARRKVNIAMNKCSIDFAYDGTIDYLVIPQDDSAPYGLTAKDQLLVKEHITKLNLETKVLMYDDADAVTNTLLARAINEVNHIKPKVYVRYNTCSNGNLIPHYEDRPLSISIDYQILSAGGITCSSEKEADLVLMVNCPLANMKESRHLYDCLHFKENPGENVFEYNAGRNMVEFIEHIKYLIDSNKTVGIADVAYSNGGDTILVKMLRSEKLLFKVDGYAGWNTAANTLGTVIPFTMISKIYGKSQATLDFLGLRYLEDCGYQSNVRFDTFDKFKNEFAWGKIDGKKDGKVAKCIRNGLEEFAKNKLSDDEYEVILVDHEQPWNRFFETGIEVNVKKR